MKEIMGFLADNWLPCYIVCTVLCVGGYLIYSISLVRSCRKIGYDVGVGGMVPVWNLLVLIKKLFKAKKKAKKPHLQDDIEFEI